MAICGGAHLPAHHKRCGGVTGGAGFLIGKITAVDETNTVRGEVVLPNTELPNQTADVIVQVEDVSRADAPSIVVAEQRMSGVPVRAGQVLPFSVEIPAEHVDPKHSYSVRAHVDMSGSGEVEVGDLISTKSYPVLTHGYGNEAQVNVKKI